jgi:Tol biopolymer transport system component
MDSSIRQAWTPRAWLAAFIVLSATIAASADPLVRAQQRLGPVGKMIGWRSYSVAPCHFAWIDAAQGGEGGYRVLLDGAPSPTFRGVVKTSLRFAPGGDHLAYVAFDGAGWRVVLDQQPGPPFREVLEDSLSFSPDGRRLAYAARRDGRDDAWVIVADGTPGAVFDGVQKSPPIFSPDGRRLAYTAHRGGKRIVVVDGVEFPHEHVTLPTFSPDSHRVAFGAVDPAGKWHVCVDGQLSPPYEAAGGDNRLFSPDSKRLAYMIKEAGQCFAVVDGEPGPPFEAISPDTMRFSPDSRHFAYGTIKAGPDSGALVLDGRPIRALDGVIGGTVRFSPDSRRVSFVAGKLHNGGAAVVVDGRVGPTYELIGDGDDSNLFSPDSRHHVYVAKQNGTWCVVLDGVPQREYDQVGMGSLRFSPDSKRLGYVAMRGRGVKRLAVVDGQEGPEYDRIPAGPFFSPDSRHVVYAAMRDQSCFVVIDGDPGPAYRALLTNPAFHADGGVEFIVIVEDAVQRVTVRPEGQ